MRPDALRMSSLGRLWTEAEVPQAWRSGLLRLGLAWLALIAAFATDWLAMARQWWDISTYNHILLVPVIVAWLAWHRRAELLKLEPGAWWPGLVLLAGAALFWMLGALSGLNLARQVGAVAMLGACVPLLLGPRVAWGLLFPLCYMAFLVPFGEEFVTVLQTITAKITVGLTHLSGIAAHIDGVFINTPAGLFQVAEACSGVKFLIAMIAFGVLCAQACFVSWPRRAAMLAVCVIVPVLANGVRAWGTIFAAQYVGAAKAAGIDHIIYGWVFFAVVLAVVILGAWPFFDRRPEDPVIDAESLAANPVLTALTAMRWSVPRTVVAALLIVALVRGWAALAGGLSAPVPTHIDLPAVSGWQRSDYAPRIWWEPRASGADHRLLGRYSDPDGAQVDVFYALYSGQDDDREAGGFGQGALTPDSAWAWQSAGPRLGNGNSERLLGGGTLERVAVTWYRTGGMTTASNGRLKLRTIADHLLLRERPTILLIVSAEEGPRHSAQQDIAKFLKSTGPLDEWMDRIAQLR